MKNWRERKRTYDQVKRKRQFQTSWQKNRNWLVHNSEIDRMTGSVCTQYASLDRMMMTLVMLMFQVMTIELSSDLINSHTTI
jgi:hypothetical protein